MLLLISYLNYYLLCDPWKTGIEKPVTTQGNHSYLRQPTSVWGQES